MDDEILVQYIRQHLKANTSKTVMFSWHGGEPLLAGIDFYRKATDIQKIYLPKGKSILNGIQTNGTLLNDEWCRFLKSEGFIIGLSLDGPEPLHNQFRKDRHGKGTFDRVMKGLELLQKYNIQVEILCVVGRFNVEDPLEVYRFLRNTGVSYITFLPLVERISENSDLVSENTVPAEKFGEFLSTIFNEWVENDIGQVKIQIFEEAMRTAFNQEHSLCIFRETCGEVPVVEHNGNFYSCDHYVNQENFIGNLKDKNLSQLLDCPQQKNFGNHKRKSLPLCCRECTFLDYCNGECPKNRFIDSGDGETGLNYLCEGYKIFFNHIRPFSDAVRYQWLKQ
jgi:uncharacterized protein